MSAATDAPPSYIQAINDVSDIIKKLPIASKTKVYEKMQTELKNPETQKSLVQEVKKLANDAKDIGKLFQSVTLKLEIADKEEYLGVEKLAPGWRLLHTVSLSRKCVCRDSSDHNFNHYARDMTTFLRSRRRRPQTQTVT